MASFRPGAKNRWIAIAVWTDQEWARLCRIMGRPATPWPAIDDRSGAAAEVEALVGAWTEGHEAGALAQQLQSEGIEAFAVQDFADVLADPQLAAHDHFVVLEHPEIGPHRYERSSFRMSASTGAIASPGPTLGQHTESALRDLIGLTDVEIDRLRSAGVLA